MRGKSFAVNVSKAETAMRSASGSLPFFVPIRTPKCAKAEIERMSKQSRVNLSRQQREQVYL